MSIDTKKRSYRVISKESDKCIAQRLFVLMIMTFSFSDGLLIPHGIYDVSDNKGYVSLGTGKKTAELICDNIVWFWTKELQHKYPQANTMLTLCDGGGANSCLHYIFKYRSVKLAKSLNMNIIVSHYPAYCSKYNSIEHRLFSQITNTWDEKPLYSVEFEFAKELTQQNSTKTGLEVKVKINAKVYQDKTPVPQKFKDNINDYIIFDDIIPKWNYAIKVC